MAPLAGHGPHGGSNKAAASWATPRRLLALFCIMSLFIFLDRGGCGGACCRCLLVRALPACLASPASPAYKKYSRGMIHPTALPTRPSRNQA